MNGGGREALQGLEERAVGEDGGDDDGRLIEEAAMRAGDAEGEVSRRLVNAARAAKR